MKPLIVLCILVTAVSLAADYPIARHARVVRVAPDTNSVSWRLSVNGVAKESLVPPNDLKNVLAELHLRHGDLILLGRWPSREPGPMAETWTWLAGYSDTNKVAVYLYGVYEASVAAEMFSIPTYHWAAPFDYPMNLKKASFFREGRLLGVGSAGFKRMLDEISKGRSKETFLLGSSYDITRSFPPLATPYERERARLNRISEKAGTMLLQFDPLPGF